MHDGLHIALDLVGETLVPGQGGAEWQEEATDERAIRIAVNEAFNNGTGSWPTMKVEERIKCVEKFAELMATKRDEVVNFIMWEIGKTLPDSKRCV